MKTKNKITEDNYQEIVLKRSIIICWVLLAICLVIELFGGNFFAIVCTNENFVKVCEFIDTSFTRYIMMFLYFMFDSCMIFIIIAPHIKLKSKRFFTYLVFCLIYFAVKILAELGIAFTNNTIMSFVTILYLYLILAFTTKRYVASIFVVFYDALLVSLSSIIKNISFSGFMDESMLIAMIFYIDYYTMLILTHLYTKLYYNKKLKKEIL